MRLLEKNGTVSLPSLRGINYDMINAIVEKNLQDPTQRIVLSHVKHILTIHDRKQD